jgi:DNA-directed RNA polymerase specialized sigma24 family protein
MAVGTDKAEEAFASFVERHWGEALRFFERSLYRDRDRANAEDCAQEAFIKLARRYRDETALVRAVVAAERQRGGPVAPAAFAPALGATAEVATTRAARCAESGWLARIATEDGPHFGSGGHYPGTPIVLDLAPLAAMRWATYRHTLSDYGRRPLAAQNARTDDLARLREEGFEPPDRAPGPVGVTFSRALHEQLAACLAALGRAERTVLILHYFHGLRFPAIAALPALAPAFARTGQPPTNDQQVQRVKDLAKAGRRQLRRSCAHLAAFASEERDDGV